MIAAGGSSAEHPATASREESTERRWAVLRRHVEDGVPLTVLAIEHGFGLRTLERWHAAYRRGGVAALVPAGSKPRRSRIGTEQRTLIEGLALVNPRLSTAAVHRRINQIGQAKGWPTVSYSTVRTITAGIDPGMLTLAHKGPVEYRDKFELAWRHRAERPNALWQADHTELDILVLDGNRAPARPWLTVVLDDYSRAVCGYMVFLGAPSAMNTALALRQGIWPKAEPDWPMCGIPEVLYVDHGTDFTSNHLAQTAKDLHFEIIYSTVARPQGRGKIERLFGTINTELLADLPGHLTEGQRRPVPVLTLPELDTAVGTFITQTYHQREHPEIKTTPTAAWTGDGWLPRLPSTVDELNLLLLTVATPRIVHRDGVHFQGLRYVSPLLAAYVGEQVIIRYDPRDITEIRIFHRDEYICKAIDPDHETATVSLKDIQSARTAHRRALRGQINERIAVVARYQPELASPKPTAPAEVEKKSKKPRLRTYLEDDR